MSVVTLDFVPAAKETKASAPVTGESRPREGKFRLALDDYADNYAAHQRSRSAAIAKTATTGLIRRNLKKVVKWASPLRAAYEAWLFSRGVGNDRR
jgi:hypothetical protein